MRRELHLKKCLIAFFLLLDLCICAALLYKIILLNFIFSCLHFILILLFGTHDKAPAQFSRPHFQPSADNVIDANFSRGGRPEWSIKITGKRRRPHRCALRRRCSTARRPNSRASARVQRAVTMARVVDGG